LKRRKKVASIGKPVLRTGLVFCGSKMEKWSASKTNPKITSFTQINQESQQHPHFSVSTLCYIKEMDVNHFIL